MFWIRKVASVVSLVSFLLSNQIILYVSGFSSPTSLKHVAFSPGSMGIYSPTSSHLVMPKRHRNMLKMSVAVEGKGSEPIFEKVGEGIRRDMKARLPFFKSDIQDGLNVQVSQKNYYHFISVMALWV